MGQPVRIVVADPLPIFRDGLRLLLGGDARLQIVGDIGVDPAAISFIAELKPDVLLLGGSSSACLDVLRGVTASAAPVRTIVLVTSIAAPEVIEALQSGARGVVARDSAPDVLFNSIAAVVAGEHWIGTEAVAGDAEEMLQRLDRARHDVRRFGLTRRELDIIRGVVTGETNRGIAEKLGISENTVKRHVTNIFNKVGASSRVELALFTAFHRLLDDI